MCGIVGYIGNKNCYPILLKALKRLEYRGYDSCGIATIKDNKINIIKSKGYVSNLKKKIKLKKQPKANIGIAHTRWATHGIPNLNNAHPHIDCTNSFAIVHNGIIENYKGLKTYLEEKNHIIKTDTDSEIIAHLIEEFYKKDKNLISAIKKSLNEIVGTFGLAIIHKDTNKIFAARRGSPIVIGIGHNEYYISSDVSAIIEHTKDIIYLDDDEIAEINKDHYNITNLKHQKVKKEVQKINYTLNQIEKNGYKHFMLKEICEQPTTLRNALSGRIDLKNLNSKLGGLEKNNDDFYKKINKIIIIACGTSYHCGLVAKYFMEKYLRIPVNVEFASEFRYKNPIIDSNTLTIPISQSGETADTLQALRVAKDKGSKLLGIVNKVASSIARECGQGIYIRAGLEISVASTKAFTNELVSLYLLTMYIGRIRNTIDDENAKKIINNLTRLPIIIEKIIQENKKILKIAEKYKNYNNMTYLARGINYAIALEGSLKLKEISYIHSQAYPCGELKHGPIALIDNKMPCFIIANKNKEYEKILNTINEIKSRKGEIICITTINNKDLEKYTKDIIYVPKIDYDFEPFLNVVVTQLFAYYIADLKNKKIDKPRNLAKSVTVE